MAAHGTLGEFDLSTGNCKLYVERAKQYFTANDITDASKQRAVMEVDTGATLSIMSHATSLSTWSVIPLQHSCQPKPSSAPTQENKSL